MNKTLPDMYAERKLLCMQTIELFEGTMKTTKKKIETLDGSNFVIYETVIKALDLEVESEPAQQLRNKVEQLEEEIAKAEYNNSEEQY